MIEPLPLNELALNALYANHEKISHDAANLKQRNIGLLRSHLEKFGLTSDFYQIDCIRSDMIFVTFHTQPRIGFAFYPNAFVSDGYKVDMPIGHLSSGCAKCGEEASKQIRVKDDVLVSMGGILRWFELHTCRKG